ncbi:hypothetical protein SEA_APPLETREE2_22 [Mycobacterium phage Appletree2]|nr:hypothetical protein SEA_APPLETREE2_22 [Mycobacterium phage Appletree2]
MAFGISKYLANKLLDHAFRNTTYTPPTTIYAKLHTGDPGANGTANASLVTTRIAVSFSAASDGIIIASNSPEFTLVSTETIEGVSFWDAATGGNFLYSSPAIISKGGTAGDIIRLSEHTIGLLPIAA